MDRNWYRFEARFSSHYVDDDYISRPIFREVERTLMGGFPLALLADITYRRSGNQSKIMTGEIGLTDECEEKLYSVSMHDANNPEFVEFQINTSAGKPVVVTVYMPAEAEEALSEIMQTEGVMLASGAVDGGQLSSSCSHVSSDTSRRDKDTLGSDLETTKPYYPYPVAGDGHDDEALWGLPEWF